MTPSTWPFSSSKQATGRLSDPAMDLVKFIVKDSPSRANLNTF